ncbi:IQ-domain 28, putative isoform 3 [Hibiscus syriacus]|uniref:IQ-domain 28, putative isoform 3 n=1 Tax=Hibiscus syriacus TaxID=106335 RepID=A0A6A3A347_HIBSY|nr:IQ-domain 28, putative isoform 3 [Hibiscus syriacus]
MGKSPGKWIKTVFFGKRTSKTGYHKRRGNAANVKEVLVAVRASETDVAVAPPFSSQLNPYANERDERKLEVKNNEAANISNDDGISLPVSQGIDSPSSTLQDSQYDPERVKEEQAATIVKAAFRGYLARRAFGALKAIIRLQALIRGHLVRRQAITTLFCMMGIVKLQAHVRGVMARHSDGGLEVQKKLNQMNLQESNPVASLGVNKSARIGKLSENALFVSLLLHHFYLPLLLHVDAGEPNSVRNWLERWIRPANLDGTSVLATSEFDKPKRNLRKFPAIPLSQIQCSQRLNLKSPKPSSEKVSSTTNIDIVEQSLNSLTEKIDKEMALTVNSSAEKMKNEMSVTVTSSTEEVRETTTRNSAAEKMNKETDLKINNSAEKMKKETAVMRRRWKRDCCEVNGSAEKMKEIALTVKSKKEIAVKVNGSAEKMKEIALTVNSSAEKVKKEIAVKVNGSAEKGKKEIAVEVNGSAEKMKKETTWQFQNQLTMKLTVKGNKTSAANVELKRKDDSMNNENQKSSRKAFNPANQDHTENGPQISPPLPSYMAATESAKAKLRLQGSPRSGQDGDDKIISLVASLCHFQLTVKAAHSHQGDRDWFMQGKKVAKAREHCHPETEMV